MTARDTPWPDGTPCWADLGAPDIAKAREFYSDVFSWTVQPGGPETGGYSVAELNGRGVAGVGPKMGPPEAPIMWMTYLATSDADATAAKIKGAGGQLVMEPMDVMDVGRMAVAVDPAGAVFGVWQARAFPGAQIVNEPGAMCWNEQMSWDFEGSKAFYAAVFGYEYGDMSGTVSATRPSRSTARTSAASATFTPACQPIPQPAGGCTSARRTPTPRSPGCRPTAARSSASR